MHFHLGGTRGGRAVSVFQQTLVIYQWRQNNCTDLGAEIHGLVGAQQEEGRLTCLEEQKRSHQRGVHEWRGKAHLWC